MVILCLAILSAAGCTVIRQESQTVAPGRYTDLKLKDVTPVIPEMQEYDVVIKKQVLHPIENKVMLTEAVRATYRVLDNDSVAWYNVGLAKIADLRQAPVDVTAWPEFDGWSYKTKNAGFLKAEVYENLPPRKREWARMLSADAAGLHEVGWYILDSLEFQRDFFPALMNDFDIALEGSYTFASTYLKYTWSGFTRHNGEWCAVVKFESLFNPAEIAHAGQTVMKGRSMYYGEWWVSLEDKQIEYSEMVEDVIFHEYHPEIRLFDMQRIVTFNKVK